MVAHSIPVTGTIAKNWTVRPWMATRLIPADDRKKQRKRQDRLAPPASIYPFRVQPQPVTVSSSRRLTRSRSSLPGLKCGTCLPGKATESPVLGLRPMRGGR